MQTKVLIQTLQPYFYYLPFPIYKKSKYLQLNQQTKYVYIPIYKIILGPSDIDSIKKYNKSTSYDDYKVECKEDASGAKICKNTFLKNLKDKKVVIYESDGSIKQLLNIKNQLIVPTS